MNAMNEIELQEALKAYFGDNQNYLSEEISKILPNIYNLILLLDLSEMIPKENKQLEIINKKIKITLEETQHIGLLLRCRKRYTNHQNEIEARILEILSSNELFIQGIEEILLMHEEEIPSFMIEEFDKKIQRIKAYLNK